MADIHFHQYTEDEKRDFVSKMTPEMLSHADDYELALYEQFVEEGCAKNDVTCLEAKAYGCYGGNAAFDCDWETSRDCLEKLLELTGSGEYANTLGYIYYYGRCSDGEPDYDNALKYFTVGAFQGIVESLYKISDMLANGYGVPKNPNSAANIIVSLFHDSREKFCREYYDCKFADIAFRLGTMLEEGFGIRQDKQVAYSCYQQANLAIRLRMKNDPQYGDTKVFARITERLNALDLELIKQEFFADTVSLFGPVFVQEFLENGYDVSMHVVPLTDGSYKITFEKLPDAENQNAFLQLVSIPEFRYCKLISRMSMRIEGIQDIVFPDDLMDFTIDEVEYDEEDSRFYFLFDGEVMMEVAADRFCLYQNDFQN